jgi:predicted secreted protein
VIRVDEHGNGSSVALRRGAELEVVLAENPGTGYRWHVSRDPAPRAVPAGDKFVPGTRPGAAGVHVWRWRAAQAGTAELAFELVRRWESRAARSFAIRLIVS